MKVNELTNLLKKCDPDTEVEICLDLPIGGSLKKIVGVEPCIDQDTNRNKYLIHVEEK